MHAIFVSFALIAFIPILGGTLMCIERTCRRWRGK